MTTFSHFVGGISSYNANVFMAALISLLLVILFVLLLHIYAKWFLAGQSRTRPRTADRFIHFPLESGDLGSKGLDSAAISSIPLFVYSSKEGSLKQGFEYHYCVICLSQFEENEAGRNLSKCGHCFHKECLDMWLHSHSNCPICRAPAEPADAPENGQVELGVTAADADADGDNYATILEEVHIRPSSDFDNINVERLRKDIDLINSMSASSSTTCIGCSLKRMLSRNRSEGKIFPSYCEEAQLQV